MNKMNETLVALSKMEESMLPLKKLENEINEICKKGGYPTYNKPSDIAKEIKEKFQIVKEECDRYPYITTTIVPKDTDLNYLDYDSAVVLNYDIDILIDEPEYPFVKGDIIINNKDIDRSKNKLIMIYLDHPAVDKRTLLRPGIDSLKNLKNITDCFVPHQYLLFKINIDNNGVEYVEYSKLAQSDWDPNDNIIINDRDLDIRSYELYTISSEETDSYKHYDCINFISSLAKRGYGLNSIENHYHEFLKDLYSKEVK